MKYELDDLISEQCDIPLSDNEYNELMKFDNHDIDISTVQFRVSTAERIAEELDIYNFC